MVKSILWRLALVAALTIYAWVSFWPPHDQSFLRTFEQQARNKDADFSKVLASARTKGVEAKIGEYEAVRDAVKEQSLPLKRYFSTDRLAKEDHDETLYDYLNAAKHDEKASADTVTQANRLILRKLLKQAAGKITLGLDLRGGSSFLLKIDFSKKDDQLRPTAQEQQVAQEQVVEIIRKRVDALGVAEPLIQPVGPDRIMVQIPGALTDEQRAEAVETLKRVSVLEFRLVYPDEERMEQFLATGEIPVGYEIKEERSRRYDTKLKKYKWVTEKLLVSNRAELGLTGQYITSARPRQDQANNNSVAFTFNAKGADIFGKITSENIGRRLAIILDGQLKSAPVINGAIYGDGEISGSFTYDEAKYLATTLQNPLEHPLSIEEERSVSATLGSESVKAGFIAGAIGIIAVFLFMAGYYLTAGIAANICQILNLILLVGVLAQLGFTLTLPGIAGLILTVGMAVDANVLIYERLREEQASGKKLAAAVPAAFGRTFWTIWDSNLTTIITAIALIKFGSGPVLGFAVVLTAGIITSIFAALVISRIYFDGLVLRGKTTSIKMFHLIKSANFDFLRWKWWTIGASATIIVIGLAVCFARGDKMYGVDFLGGDSISLKFEKRIDTEEMSAALAKAGVHDVALQYQTQLQAGGSEILSMKTPFEKGDATVKALQTGFPDAKFVMLGRVDKVGPSLGFEFAFNSAIGLALGLLGILMYVSIRFEFSFAIGAIVALFHDVIITIVIMVMLGYQMNLPMIGALLTIAGYSINDTIVIFDRIREGLKLKADTGIPLDQIMNTSINETLSRTLLTGGSTILTLLAILFFGGSSIQDFTLAILIGVLVGTYSSIFIASPIVLLWGQRKGNLHVGDTMAAKPM